MIAKEDLPREEFLDPNSNLSHVDRPYPNIWNESSKDRFRFITFSQYNDSKSQSHVNHDDMHYQSSLAHNQIPNLVRNPSISSIENKGSCKNSLFEGNDESSIILKKAILDSSAAVLDEQSKYELPIASSKEGSVLFNMNQHRNRDIINDTQTDQSEKLRLEYLESNESSLMIKAGKSHSKI
jgi:hypothetical protein